MDDKNEVDTHSAAQGLLDFAQKVTASRSETRHAQNADAAKTSSSGRDVSPADVARKQVASPRPSITTNSSGASSLGRIVTSGNHPVPSRLSQDILPVAGKQGEAKSKGSFRQPAPRRPEAQERVTVIVQKNASKDDKAAEKAEPTQVSCDVPVPASAFAPVIGSGDSGKSSADFTPFTGAIHVKEPEGSDGETESDDRPGDAEGKVDDDDLRRPQKRQKMTRTVSLNTILQRVGSKDAPLLDAVGLAPQTVQEIVPHIPARTKDNKRGDAPVDTLDIVEKLWGPSKALAPKGPSLPPRKSSDQSTVEVYRQLAQAESGPGQELSQRLSNLRDAHAASAEHALHLPPKATPPTGGAPSSATPEKHQQLAATQPAVAGASPLAQPLTQQESPEAEPGSVLWTGSVKHCLRTAEGSSVVHLFDLSALVPAKLSEQMPPTLFVSALAGRANVKLGKHYVTRCQFGALSERQRQKVLALAAMKLVAICELQHCSLTLVPFTGIKNDLRVVGFMIADD